MRASVIGMGLALLGFAMSAGAQEHSALWGRRGEKWSPAGRLPDFSYAGYRCGEAPIPRVRQGASVAQFGAKGDGRTDDTQAFLDAIGKAPAGAIYVPPGRYRITRILEIRRSGLVLRGAGPDKTTLVLPKPLNDIRPNWGATTGGRRTSNYSWSGGFLWVQGSYDSRTLAKITAPAKRGEAEVRVSSAGGLKVGQWVEVYQRDEPGQSLCTHLYSGDPGDITNVRGRTRASLVARVAGIRGDRVTIDRPLRFDVETRWKPVVRRFAPTVTEVGIEDLRFEFPNVPYKGHFTELGFNPLTFRGTANCWARNLVFANMDSGIMAACRFCTFTGIVLESSRRPDRRGYVGHHGIYLQSDDNLYTDFTHKAKLIHDLSVSHCAGNVCSNGRGVDLCFDHHKRTPHANCFTNIDLGEGSRMYMCGGGGRLGKNCAARGTFWNLRAKRPLAPPPSRFGPASMNFVGLTTRSPSVTDLDGTWFEAVAPARLVPPNIHEAQLARRLARTPPARAGR